MMLILVPQGAEYQAVCRGLHQSLQQIQPRPASPISQPNPVQVISIPIGAVPVRRQLQQLIQQDAQRLHQAQSVLVMGLCGSLSPQFRIGDVALHQHCCDRSGQRLDCNPTLTQTLQTLLSVQPIAALSWDRMVWSTAEKQQLGQTYSAAVIEMEGMAVLSELKDLGLPIAMIRVVSDDLGQDLPDLNPAIDREGRLQSRSLAIALLKNPLAAGHLIRGAWKGLQQLQATSAIVTRYLLNPVSIP